MVRRLLALVLVLFLLTLTPLFAGQTIPVDVEAGLNSKGFAIYPGAVYCTGTVDIGIRFASRKSTDEVKSWYKEKYPDWSVMDEYGSWVLYKGAPGASMPEVMSSNQILIQKNVQLPSWHSLSADMTTEIMASFPE